MFRQLPIIETIADAVDELTDVRMTLSGLASLTLALANSGMHEPDTIRLISCLLDYCALTPKPPPINSTKLPVIRLDQIAFHNREKSYRSITPA